MTEPIALFGLKVKPGDVHRMNVVRDFKVTNVSFAADTLKGNSRSVVKVHLTPSFDHPLNEQEEADQGVDEDESEDEDEEEKEPEERSYVLCTLTPGKIEQVSVDIAFSEMEEVGFSVTGDNEVDLLGNFLASADEFDQPPYDSDSSDDDEDEYSDDDEYDSEEMAADGLDDIMAEGDSDSEEDEQGTSRFEELGDVPSVAATEKAAASAASKKRKAVADPEPDVDVSMSSVTAPVTDSELAKVAAAEGLDATKLSKAQRKRLNKKIKGEAADADASVVSATSEKPASKATETVKSTVVQDGKAKTAAKEVTAKDGKQVSIRIQSVQPRSL